MKRTILIAILMCAAVTLSVAQLPSFGVGVEAALPSGTFADAAGMGFGGSLIVELDLPVVSVYAAGDYLMFAEKEVSTTVPFVGTFTSKSSSSMFGINAGVKLSILPLVYAGAEVGQYFITSKVEFNGATSESSQNKTAIAPMVGASLLMLDVSARYVIMSDANMVVIRGAITF